MSVLERYYRNSSSSISQKTFAAAITWFSN